MRTRTICCVAMAVVLSAGLICEVSAKPRGAGKAKPLDLEALEKVFDIQERVVDVMENPLLAGQLAITRIKEMAVKNKQFKKGAELLGKIAAKTPHAPLRRSALFAASDLCLADGETAKAAEAMALVAIDKAPGAVSKRKPCAKKSGADEIARKARAIHGWLKAHPEVARRIFASLRASAGGPARAQAKPPAAPHVVKSRISEFARRHPVLARIIRMRMMRHHGPPGRPPFIAPGRMRQGWGHGRPSPKPPCGGHPHHRPSSHDVEIMKRAEHQRRQAIEEQARKLREAAERQRREMEHHEHRMRQAEHGLRREREKLERHARELRGRTEEIERLRRDTERRHEELNKRDRMLHERAERLEGQEKRLGEHAEHMKRKWKTLEERAERLEGRERELDERAESLQGQEKELDERAESLQGQEKELDERREELEGREEELDESPEGEEAFSPGQRLEARQRRRVKAAKRARRKADAKRGKGKGVAAGAGKSKKNKK